MGNGGAPFVSFRDLEAWQEAMALTVRVYALSERFPSSERFGLCSQLRRAAVSIPSNLVEGHARGATRDFIRFIGMARGSLAEVQTQVEIAGRLGYIDLTDESSVMAGCDKLGRILRGLRKSLERNLAQR
ncbi:four helix bundle protein [Luteibacter sp. 3190]|uniref:four helix bundle protein n=1 Tax=Luteibacter sp. 3190 TaxID=2817736 RepID=UPI00286BAF7D|nr:four helix bundle protein [Luteibacter sp. 3190]